MNEKQIEIHPFEKRGLGRAPFRCVGVEHRVGPIRTTDPTTGVTMEVGSPGQPMGTCDFCGTGIADCYVIRSADGRHFVVGCDCVARTTNENAAVSELERSVADARRELNRQKREARVLREEERIERAYRIYDEDAGVRDLLASQNVRPRYEGGPMTNDALYVEWCRKGAGHTGRLRCAKMIEKAQDLLGPTNIGDTR